MTKLMDCCGGPLSRAEQRRQQVTDAARKLFTTNGFHATGIAQIARESGVAVGQIYRDFGAKEDIVAAIVNSDCRTFMAAETLRMAIEKGDESGVREWIHQFVDPQDKADDGCLFAEILAESTRNERIAGIFNTVNDDMRTKMLAALKMLAPRPELSRRRATVAETIMTMSLGLLHHQLLRPTLDIAPVVQSMVAIIDRDIDDLQAARAAA